MRCLKCDQKMTKRIDAGVVVDYCKTCDGIWFDRNEFELMLASNNHMTRAELRDLMIKESERETLQMLTYKGMCQRCGGSVRECKFHGIIVDKCTCCSGLYFEHNELEKCLAKCQSQNNWLSKLFSLMCKGE